MILRAIPLAVLVAFVAGLYVGALYIGTPQEDAEPTGTARAAPSPPTPPSLRCGQQPGGEPAVWSQVDAEAWVHVARVALDTARGYGGAMTHKLAWATEAQAALELVRLCWR